MDAQIKSSKEDCVSSMVQHRHANCAAVMDAQLPQGKLEETERAERFALLKDAQI
jgi:hypothetical protein